MKWDGFVVFLPDHTLALLTSGHRYPFEQCTWQDEKDMTEPMKLIEAFTDAAEKEGVDLGSPSEKILLSEVERSGWIDPDD